MQVTGHLSVALLCMQAHRPWTRPVLGAALLGALLPDMIDKPIWLLNGSLYGRTIGHSLLVWTPLALIMLSPWFMLRIPPARQRWWMGLMVGVWSHFVADGCDDVIKGLLSNGYVYTSWGLWPLHTPDHYALWLEPWVAHVRDHSMTPLEGLAIGWALSLAARQRMMMQLS